jgi:[ribosomal protein S18]-alanine N-acetyltransferase
VREGLPPLFVDEASADDLPALLEIETSSYSHPWTRRNFEGELGAGESRIFLVLRAAGRAPLPRSGLYGYCVFHVVANEMHVMNLTVAPDGRGLGLGRFLLGVAKDLAARRGAREAFLEVRESNLAARALYRSAGFKEVGRRPGYYNRPREDALLLRHEALAGAGRVSE